MNLWSRLTTWLSGKSAPAPYASGSLGGPSFPIDAFRKHRAPTPTELLGENLGTAYACATLNADLLASTRLGLYVTTGRGEAQSKMSKRGETRPIVGKELARLKAASPAGSRIRAAAKVEEVLSHPALELLNRPNPLADGVGLSLYELFNFTQLYQEIVGRSYWAVERDGLGGTPSAIWILASHQVREVCDGSTERIIDHYEFAGRDRYEPDRIVPFRMPDLRNPYTGGVSPLRAVIEQVRIGRKLDAHTGALLDNQARPDGLFIPKGSAEGYDIGEVGAARLEAAINRRFRAAGRGGIMVAEHDGQVHPLQWPTRDLADLEQLKLGKTQIANAFGVPTSKLDRNDANLASAKTGDYAHAKDAGVPRVKRNEAALNAFFVPMYDPSGRLFFSYDSPIPDDREQDREDTKVMVAAGAVTRNELREDAGRETRDDMEAPLAPKDAVAVDEQGKPVPPAPASAINLNMPPGKGGDPAEPTPAPEHQSDAVNNNDLRATVGGSQAVRDLQTAFYTGQMPREAAIANATLVFGFKPDEAEQLFPDKEPQNKPEPEPQPKPADNAGGGKDAGKKAIVGNVGKDGLAGKLPQGRQIEATLKSIFARQRKAVLKLLEGKSLVDVETKLIGDIAAAGKDLYTHEQLHAWLRTAAVHKNKRGDDVPPGSPPAAGGEDAGNPLANLPSKFIDLSDWDETIADAVRPLIEVIVTKGAEGMIARVGASDEVFSVV